MHWGARYSYSLQVGDKPFDLLFTLTNTHGMYTHIERGRLGKPAQAPRRAVWLDASQHKLRSHSCSGGGLTITSRACGTAAAA